jgi:hypothetical protein
METAQYIPFAESFEVCVAAGNIRLFIIAMGEQKLVPFARYSSPKVLVPLPAI